MRMYIMMYMYMCNVGCLCCEHITVYTIICAVNDANRRSESNLLSPASPLHTCASDDLRTHLKDVEGYRGVVTHKYTTFLSTMHPQQRVGEGEAVTFELEMMVKKSM